MARITSNGRGQPRRRGRYAPSADSPHEEARLTFLHAVQEVCPAALDGLGAEPLRLYREGASQNRDRPSCSFWENSRATTPFEPDDPEYPAFLASLTAWADRWGLNTAWCLQRAVETLRQRVMGEHTAAHQLHDPMRWGASVVLMHAPLPEPIVFQNEGWSPTLQRRADYRQSAVEKFLDDLSTYLDRIEMDAEAAGMVRTPLTTQMDHFRWLALYQVREWSHKEIAKEFRRDRSVVAKAVPALASRIGLPLRPPWVN